MAKKKPEDEVPELIATWELPLAATFGSDVRVKGILLEMRARLPVALRKSLDVEGRTMTLAMAAADRTVFRSVGNIVGEALRGIETLPVIPREIEDILAIKTS